MILVRRSLEKGRKGMDVAVEAHRETLAKRRWRGVAADGKEFGFDLEEPLQDGDYVHVEGKTVYGIRQLPEAVLEVALQDPQRSAQLGWMLGNLHFPIEITANSIRVRDDTAVRQMLERECVPFGKIQEVFKPLAGGTSHHSQQHFQHHSH